MERITEKMTLTKKQKQRRKEMAIRKKQSWRSQKKKLKCEWCGTNKNITIDHIKQQSWGGNHNPKNLRVLCRKCHDKRHGM